MKWFLKHKIKAGALQFSVFIAVLIALLLSGLLLLAYTFVFTKEQSKAAIEIINNSNLGIDYVLQSKNGFSQDTIAITSLLNNENQSLTVNVTPWGVFGKAVAESSFRTKHFTKVAIIGGAVNRDDDPTLYVQNLKNPLSVVGTTEIRGNSYLAEQGVKSGYINGNSYFGKELVYGEIKRSDTDLPKIDSAILEYLKLAILNNNNNTENNLLLQPSKNYRYSFKQKTNHFYSKNKIILTKQILTGNMVIKSDSLIVVTNSAKLSDVILIAPFITIETGTKGVFQAIASVNITVEKGCELNYPSALVLFNDNLNTANQNLSQAQSSGNKIKNQIFIDKNSFVKGSVFYYQTRETNDFETQLVIEENTAITGQVYCKGNTEVKGKVSGSIYCKQFIANEAGSIFVNHIYNGTVTNQNIPLVLGGLIFENKSKIVMKWLY